MNKYDNNHIGPINVIIVFLNNCDQDRNTLHLTKLSNGFPVYKLPQTYH